MKFEQIKKTLDSIIDPVEKLEFVMDLGKELAPVPAGAECTEILGCREETVLSLEMLG